MEVIQTILTALISAITLIILSRLIGNREMSQLSVFDYINSITIGSIAAEMATCRFTDMLKPFTSMVVFALFNILLSVMTNKSVRLRRLLTGTPSVLYDNGELYYQSFIKAKMDLGEFLALCRINGYFNLSDLQTVLLEANGKISFLPVAHKRPITGDDLNLDVSQNYLVANVIIDGKIMIQNLKHIGYDEEWLIQQLYTRTISDISKIFLATCDHTGTLCIYEKLMEQNVPDLLE